MNPLDATIIRLGIYIGQLENQVSELHKQLLEKSKEFDEYRKAKESHDKALNDLNALSGLQGQFIGSRTKEKGTSNKGAS